MSRTGTWSFATAAGRVEVAPDEVRVRRRGGRTCCEAARSLASGRLPAVGRDVGVSALGAAFGAVGVLLEWAGDPGAGVGVAAFGLATAFAGVGLSALRNARTEVPLREVRHVAFRDGEVVVVREGDAGDRAAETTLSPRSPADRNDAALAFRLRGVDLRGAEDAEGVSRTAVDAPETELVA